MKKILTFSFDDAVVQDRRLVDLFNRYEMRGTFNICSGLLNCRNLSLPHDPLGGRHTITSGEVATLYHGHEIAAHTLTHPLLPTLSDEEVITAVEEDCRPPPRCSISHKSRGVWNLITQAGTHKIEGG